MDLNHCIVHYCTTSESLLCKMTDRTKARLLEYSEIWKTLEYDENIIEELQISQNIKEVKDWTIKKFHRKCYNKFTDKTRFEAASKRQMKKAQKVADGQEIICKLPKREPSLETDIFKEECIFCGAVKTRLEVFSKKRVKEPLTKCMSADSQEKIKQKAFEKDDFDLIGMIADQDLIAREAKYHKSCYNKYLYNYGTGVRGRQYLYKESWKVFEVYIKRKLITENMCMTMQNLLEEFKKTVLSTENLDASAYKSSALKKRLKNKFPLIQFHKQGNCKNKSEIVSIYNQSSQMYSFTAETFSEYTTSTDDETSSELQRTDFDFHATRNLYYAAKYLIKKTKELLPLNVPWPPTAENLKKNNVLQMVPTDLLNFLAWLFGEEDPLFISDKDSINIKTLSIAQDIIYLMAEKARHTPK